MHLIVQHTKKKHTLLWCGLQMKLWVFQIHALEKVIGGVFVERYLDKILELKAKTSTDFDGGSCQN